MANSGTRNGAVTTTDASTSRTNLGIGTMGVVATPVPLANGGTAQTSFTANAIISSDATSFTTVGPGTDGQILIGSASSVIWANVTSTNSSIIISPGANSMVLSMAQATTSQFGGSELATDAEAVTGSNTTNVITPANLTARLAAPGPIGGTTPAQGKFSSVILTSTSGPTITTGSGAPAGSAPVGSVYFRTNGTTTITRAYINTNGSTTWTPLITVA